MLFRSVAVQSLADRLEEVATERLVFLTAVREGVVGFEVRSLQEFMAGEFLIDLPESEIPDLLRRVALSAYWRNAQRPERGRANKYRFSAAIECSTGWCQGRRHT